MGLVQVPECDVFGTRRNVEQYTLTLTRKVMGADAAVWRHDKHLSPRGERRLTAFVQRGLKPGTRGGGPVSFDGHSCEQEEV